MVAIDFLKLMYSRLFSYSEASFWRVVIEVFASQAQGVDDATRGLIDERKKDIDNLTGEILKQEGKLFNVFVPDSLTDIERQGFIKAGIAALNSTGSLSDIISIVDGMTNPNDIQVYNTSGVYIVNVDAPTPSHLLDWEVTDACQKATAAGNRCQFVAEGTPTTLTYDDPASLWDVANYSKVL